MGMATASEWMRRPPPNGVLLAFRIGGKGKLARLPPVEPRPFVTSDERFTAAPVAANAEAWRSVVFDGALADRGMISFKPWLTAGQVEAVRAYVLTQAAQR